MGELFFRTDVALLYCVLNRRNLLSVQCTQFALLLANFIVRMVQGMLIPYLECVRSPVVKFIGAIECAAREFSIPPIEKKSRAFKKKINVP